MPVEQRWSERKPIALDVTLYYPPVGTILGRTRDISLEGMYVETDVELPVEAELEITFVTDDSREAHEHNMPAFVVHSNGTGAGLMLRHVDYTDFYALRHMLNAA